MLKTVVVCRKLNELFLMNFKSFLSKRILFSFNYRLQEWAKIALNSNHTLEYLAAVHLETFTHTTELKRLEAGYIIKEMLDRFEKKSQQMLQPNSSLWIYVAHDLSLVNILNALDLYEVCL